MNCPECHYPLRVGDLSFGICWRCGVLLAGEFDQAQAVAIVCRRPPLIELVETLADLLNQQPLSTESPGKSPGDGPIAQQGEAVMLRSADNGMATPGWRRERRCGRCGGAYVPHDPQQVYCLRSCADAAERDRQAERHIRLVERRTA